MNKLMGFLELKEMNLPSVPWKEYTGSEEFDPRFLWTIRSAVYRGNDLNLPRLIGEDSITAQNFAKKLYEKMSDKGIVIYYPYFIAEKSGTLCVGKDRIVIEAVKEDLWNLVTFSKRDITIIETKDAKIIDGDKNFLSEWELQEIYKYLPEIKRIFREDILSGKEILLEWSFANPCDRNKIPIEKNQLIFYEARTI